MLVDSAGGMAHIATCDRCERRVASLRDATQVTHMRLTRIDTAALVNAEESYRRLRPRLIAAESGSTGSFSGGIKMSEFSTRRSVRVSAATVAAFAMVIALALSPMRTVANDFFNQFRVQKFAAVTIPMVLMAPLNSGLLETSTDSDKQDLKDRLEGLGAFETTFGLDDLPRPRTVEDARAAFGDFATPDADELPDGFDTTPNVYVTKAGRASYAMDVSQVRGVIDEMNLPIYALDAIDATTLDFEVNVPQAVVLEYKNAIGERVLVGEMASPELSFPDELDMNQLREEILRFPGLPTDLVAQLRAIDDWESTLIIPIPEGADSDDVTINGEPGLLIEHDLGSAILWEDNGILHLVAGQVSADAVQDIADSMD